MTIASALSEPFRARPRRAVDRRVFKVDNETSVVGLCDWQPDRTHHPTVIVIHGLTGHADATYVATTADKAFQRGFNTVRLNARNCGNTEALTPTLYHTGLSGDLGAVIDHLHADGLQEIHAIGFSMGGNVVLKYAGERGADSALSSVAVVSPPIELAAASAAIDRGFLNGIYQESFLRSLKALIRRKAKLFPGRYDVELLRGITNLRTFDNRFIAPCFGFRDADDYYHRGSAARHIDDITVPTLVIHAEDDSIVPAESLAEWRSRAKPNVRIDIRPRGGHVGFLALAPRHADADRFWAENRVVDWVVDHGLGT